MDVAVILMSGTVPSCIPTGCKCLHEHAGSGVTGSSVGFVNAEVVIPVTGREIGIYEIGSRFI